MLRLIYIHFNRAIRDKMVIIFTIAIFAIAVITSGVYAWLYNSTGDITNGNSLISPFTTILNSFQVSSTPGILFAIMLLLFIRKDINYGTLRNQVVAGYSKIEIYFSYVIVSLIIGGIGMLIFQLTGFALPSAFMSSAFAGANYGIFWAKYGLGVLIFLVMISAIVFCSLVFKNSLAASFGVLIILPVVATFAITIIFTVCSVLSIDTKTVVDVFGFIYYFQALNVSGGDLIFSMDGSTNVIDLNTFAIKTICTNVALLALINIGGCAIFNKSDLK